MIALICFVLTVLASPFKSNIWLEAENAVLRHQLIVLRPKLKGRLASRTMTAGSSSSSITGSRRSFGSDDYSTRNACGLASGRLSQLLVLEIASTGGRPQIETELPALIRQMSTEN
jgi:hypothetical protein